MQDQVALITGGSKGLGTAMAAALASAGASVALVSRNQLEVDAAAKEIGDAYGVTARGYVADVSDPEAVNAMVSDVHQQFGRIDVLINNAGINIRGSIEDLTYEEFQAVQKTNVDGIWLCCKAVVPIMKAAGLRTDRKSCQHPWACGACQPNALYVKQGGCCTDDTCPGPGTGSGRDRLQCNLPGTVFDTDEHSDRRLRRSEEVHYWRCCAGALG